LVVAIGPAHLPLPLLVENLLPLLLLTGGRRPTVRVRSSEAAELCCDRRVRGDDEEE
jgi:hypothetical protein